MRAVAAIGLGALLAVGCGYPQPARVLDDATSDTAAVIDAAAQTADARGDAPADGSPDATPLPGGLVAHCAMNDNPTDGTPTCTGATATCSACPTSTTGHISGGYMFSAASMQFVDLNPDTLVGATFTVSIWVKPGASSNFVTVFGAALGTATSRNSVAILIGSPAVGWFESTEAGNADYISSGAVNLRDGNWHHIATSWEGTTKRLYIDGVQRSSEVTPLTTGSGPTAFGADWDDNVAANFYPGALDELRIYNRALSAGEISALAQ